MEPFLFHVLLLTIQFFKKHPKVRFAGKTTLNFGLEELVKNISM